MTTRRWRLPDAPLRTSVLVAASLGLVGAALLGIALGPALHASAHYPVVVASVVAAMAVVVIGTIADAHPFVRLGPANQVTMLRAMLAALVAGLVVETPALPGAWFAAGMTGIVAALDGLDGWLARRSRMASVFGARFDMEVDAGYILLLSLLVWRFDKAGAWVLGSGLMRYAFVAAGWVLPWMGSRLTPTFRGKFVAVLQLLGLAVALAPAVPSPASDIVAAATLAALAWSFGVDVARLWRGRHDAG
jgi:phosphatidylglycerophosphate synthase